MKILHDDEIGRKREIALAIFVMAAMREPSLNRSRFRTAVREYFDTGKILDSFNVFRTLISSESFEAAESEFREGGRLGFRLIHFASPEYPPGFRGLPHPPACFWVWGCLPKTTQIVAVIGSRKSTQDGQRFAYQVAANLSENGISVVSGLARGIDAAAHRGAVDAANLLETKGEEASGGAAVLGSGLCRIYPPENRMLAEAIVSARGCIISEYSLDQAPLPFLFPDRNRLISALAERVIVVEAGEKSGSLITARIAAELGKDIFSVPGSIRSASWRGSNELLRLGARVLLSPDELEEILPLGWNAKRLRKKRGRSDLPVLSRTDCVSDEEYLQSKAILEVVDEQGILEADAIQRELELSPEIIRGRLGSLEILGFLERTIEGTWQRAFQRG